MRPDSSFVGQPIRSLQTMLRVIAEDDPRHMTVVPDGIYGPETLQAVSLFQMIHGIPVTGMTDEDTWNAIVNVYTPARTRMDEAEPLFIVLDPGQIIQKGEQHPHVHLVQAILTVLSEAHESISQPTRSGILDDTTSDSLASFQYMANLPMTGELDKVTWKHLALHYPLAANMKLSG